MIFNGLKSKSSASQNLQLKRYWKFKIAWNTDHNFTDQNLILLNFLWFWCSYEYKKKQFWGVQIFSPFFTLFSVPWDVQLQLNRGSFKIGWRKTFWVMTRCVQDTKWGNGIVLFVSFYHICQFIHIFCFSFNYWKLIVFFIKRKH